MADSARCGAGAADGERLRAYPPDRAQHHAAEPRSQPTRPVQDRASRRSVRRRKTMRPNSAPRTVAQGASAGVRAALQPPPLPRRSSRVVARDWVTCSVGLAAELETAHRSRVAALVQVARRVDVTDGVDVVLFQRLVSRRRFAMPHGEHRCNRIVRVANADEVPNLVGHDARQIGLAGVTGRATTIGGQFA